MIVGFNFKKKFGQNFLSDKNLLTSIANDAQITADSQALEIGAGAGALTEVLAENAKKVVSVEIDRDLKPYLDLLCDKYKNLNIIFGDFLKLDKETIEQNFDGKYKVVANLPYYITTPIIFRLLDEHFNAESLTLMVQKEVAERFCATVGTSDYGAVSVILQSQADLKITRIVDKSLFYPRPNVDSAVINITINHDKFKIDDREAFAKVVKASFGYRRKTLINSLQLGLGIDKALAESAVKELNKPLDIRGERLSVEDYIELTKILSKSGCTL